MNNMTLSEIISKLDEVQDYIDECTQVPSEKRNEILGQLNTVMEDLSECIDEFGEDAEQDEEDEQM